MRSWLPIVALLLIAACGGDKSSSNPTAPSPPPPPQIPACQANGTFTLSFGNRSGALTYDVFLNDIKVTTLAPGQDSASQNAAANIANRVVFRVTNTNVVACSGAPIYTPCESRIVTCS